MRRWPFRCKIHVNQLFVCIYCTSAYVTIFHYFVPVSPFGYNEFDGAGSGYAIKFASLSNIDENVVVGSTPATGINFECSRSSMAYYHTLKWPLIKLSILAGKTSILDYGSIEKIAEKLAAKRCVSNDLQHGISIWILDYSIYLFPIINQRSSFNCPLILQSGGKVVSTEARNTEGIIYYQFQVERFPYQHWPWPKLLQSLMPWRSFKILPRFVHWDMITSALVTIHMHEPSPQSNIIVNYSLTKWPSSTKNIIWNKCDIFPKPWE